MEQAQRRLEDAYQHRVVLGLDAKDGMAASDGWEQTSDRSAIDIAKQVNGWPLSAIVYTDIAVDGMLTGPNVQATAEMAAATDVPIVASGGVGTLEHLRELRKLNVQGAIIGKSLYENQFTINEALDSTLQEILQCPPMSPVVLLTKHDLSVIGDGLAELLRTVIFEFGLDSPAELVCQPTVDMDIFLIPKIENDFIYIFI